MSVEIVKTPVKTVKMPEMPEAVARALGLAEVPQVDGTLLDYFVYAESPGKWAAVAPAMKYAEVKGLPSVVEAKTALSGLVGRLKLAGVPIGVLPADYTPPEGAIRRKFGVS